MSKMTARKNRKSAGRMSCPRTRMVVLPKPGRKWLLAGTALVTGVVGGLALAPDSALAQCNTSDPDTFNCSGVDTDNWTFNPVGNNTPWVVNIFAAPPAAVAANLTGDDDDPVILVNASGLNGVVEMNAGTSITGEGSKGGADGIRIDHAHTLDLYINGTIVAENSDALSFVNSDGSTEITINIGQNRDLSFSGSGQLGSDAGDSIIYVEGGADRTFINNWGTMNGNMEFDDNAKGVTLNNYSSTTWNTTGPNDYTNAADFINNLDGGVLNTTGDLFSPSVFFLRNGDDRLRNSGTDINGNPSTINFNATTTTFLFSFGQDGFENEEGAAVTTNNLTNFFFDNPDFVNILGVDVPIPFSEEGTQYNDYFRNTKVGTVFTANDETGFFFGGGNDRFVNAKGAVFHANDLTIISMGSGNDNFYNEDFGTIFNANDGTLISFDTHVAFDYEQGFDNFYNRWGATFNANGAVVMDFGGRDDSFNNKDGATFNVNGITEVFFGDHDKFGDSAYNYATINVNGLLNMWSLEQFYNSGSGYGGSIDMRDGETNDLTSITGQDFLDFIFDPPFPTGFFGSGAFYGGYDSRLGVDAHLGPDGDPANWSDILALGGDIYGYTEVLVNNVNPGPSGFNQEGIPVVIYGHDYEGFSAYIENPCGFIGCGPGAAFAISPEQPGYLNLGGIAGFEHGLFFTYLAQDDYQFENAGAFELRTGPGSGAINAPRLITGLQDFWYHTDEVVQDHNSAYSFAGAGGGGADLAVVDYVEPVAAAPGGSNKGLWVKATGSWVDRDTTTTAMGVSVDNGSSQDIYSILGGADMKPGGADSNWRLGIYGGYGTSNLDFDLGSGDVDYEGGIIGAYVAYNTGAFYADATVKGDILGVDYSFGGVSVDSDAYNVGVRLNTGYRFTMGNGFFEPLASFTYVYSDVDDMTAGGGTVNYSNGDSLRLGGGARVGYEGSGFEVSLLGRVWNEFEGNNTVTITDGMGGTASFTDDTEGLIGEATARITVGRDLGWSGFLQGGGEWGDNDLEAYSGQVGVRYGF